MRTPEIVVLALGILALVGVGCDSVSPVAPVGSVLTITANPAQIEPNGSSQITVVARKEDGRPVNPGTEVVFSATLGTIPSPVQTDDLGVATATLRGGGQVGTSTVTAISGAAAIVTTEVQIGSFAASITLAAAPTVVNDLGGDIALTSVVRDENGQLLSNAAVNFLTEVGSLVSEGAPVFTDALGTARDTLSVSAGDLEGRDLATFAVRAQTAGTGGLLIEAVFDVAVQQLAPVASFETVDSGDCRITFSNTTTGQEPLAFEWDFKGTGFTDSVDRNPTFDYASSMEDTDGDGTKCPDDPLLPLALPSGDDTKTFSVSLTATNDLGTDITFNSVTVDPN